MFEQDSMNMLEFPVIKERLSGYMRTEKAASRARELAPMQDIEEIARAQALTASARKVYEAMGEPPVYSMKGLSALSDKLRLGEVLSIEELSGVREFLNHCRLLKSYLQRAMPIDALAPGQGMSVEPLDDIRLEIERCVRGERLDDRASPLLGSIRAQMERVASRMKDHLSSLMRAHPHYFQEAYYSQRGSRYVVPVKREYVRQVRGVTLDTSGSGATVFIEPEAVSALQAQLDQLKIDEGNEEFRILAELSDLAAQSQGQMAVNRESMEEIDFIFGCGRLAAEMKGGELMVGKRMELELEEARHPLLGQDAVPMNLRLGGNTRALVITGPNTGGKTVSIKTAGLLCLMALSGLQIPCKRAVIPLLSGVFADIGDGQSLRENLSTFSAHVTRVVRILNAASPRSLVLLDELGSGTDPQEGMGLAVAVLEELGRLKCLIMATSHYPELKRFASETEGFVNARMTFDRVNLKPLYRLEMGEAGESCALYIAQRLGVKRSILERAWRAAYPGGGEFDLSPKNQGTSAPEPQPAGEAAEPDQVQPEPVERDQPRRMGVNPPKPQPPAQPQKPVFAPGDRVRVPFMNALATVVQPPNARGELLLRIKGKNFNLPAHRVQPFLKGGELYPGADYDLDIVLDSWENRKKRNQMRKGKTGVSVEIEPGKRP